MATQHLLSWGAECGRSGYTSSVVSRKRGEEIKLTPLKRKQGWPRREKSENDVGCEWCKQLAAKKKKKQAAYVFFSNLHHKKKMHTACSKQKKRRHLRFFHVQPA